MVEMLLEAAPLEQYRRDYADTIEQLRAALKKCTTAKQFRETAAGMIRSYQVRDKYPARAVRTTVLGAAMIRPLLAEQLEKVNNELSDSMASILGGANAALAVGFGLSPDEVR